MKKLFGGKSLGERSMLERLLGRRLIGTNLKQKLFGQTGTRQRLGRVKTLLAVSLIVTALAGGLLMQTLKNNRASAYSNNHFVTRWTNLPAGELTINLHEGNNGFLIYWGDGSSSQVYTNISQISHNYQNSGTYDITIQLIGSGANIFNGWTLKDNSKARYLTHVLHWGSNVSFTNMSYMFAGASNLSSLPSTAPNTGNVTDMSCMFRDASSFNQPVNFDTKKVRNMSGMFQNATSFNQPFNFDTSEVTNMRYMFANATSFNQPVNFNTSKVTAMDYMFYKASSFDQDLSGFDFTKLSDPYRMADFVTESGLSVTNNDNLIVKWYTVANSMPRNIYVGSKGLKFCASSVQRDNLRYARGWSFYDEYGCDRVTFKTRWTNLPSGYSLHIDLHGNDNTFLINWGDGTEETKTNVRSIYHTYTSAGTRDISITTGGGRKFNGWDMSNNYLGSSEFLTHVLNWGPEIQFTNMRKMFCTAKNLNSLPSDSPNTSKVKDMSFMFSAATSFNQPINFDTSNVTNMDRMFSHAWAFNQPVNFDTSKVISMNGMFYGAKAFDQDLSNFDFSKITDQNNLEDFASTSGLSVRNYDKLLKTWHSQFKNSTYVHKPKSTNLKYCKAETEHDYLKNTKHWTFDDAKDCSSLSNPFITRWTNLPAGEFRIGLHGNDNTFNIDWDDGSPIETKTNTYEISHNYTTVGTRDIKIYAGDSDQKFNGWHLSNYDYNPTLSPGAEYLTHVVQWGNISFTNMRRMFEEAHNLISLPSTPPNTSNVTDMSYMFSYAHAFNQPVNFDTSKVTNMSYMFSGATIFNQDLSGFDFSKVTEESYLRDFASNSGLSVENYDKLLKKWHAQYKDNASVAHEPKSTGLKYCQAETEHNYLKDTRNWTFEDTKDCSGLNLAPADITLSTDQVDENNAPNFELADITITNAPDDIPGDTNTPSLTCETAGADDASFQITDNKLIFKPVADFETKNSYALCIRATDTGGLTKDKNFTINVKDINEAPTISGTPEPTVNAGVAYSFTPTATDPDTTAPNNTLTFEIENKPSWLNFDSSNGTLSGTPSHSNVGTYNNIKLRVKDGGTPALSAELPEFNIIVNSVNRAPVITSTPVLTATKGEQYNYTITATDEDNDPLTLMATLKPTWLNFDASTGVLSGTPGNDEAGNDYPVTLTVSDGTVTVEQSFTIHVNDKNYTPTISDQTFSIAENSANGTELGQVVATDPDVGQTLAYEIVSGNDLGIFELTNDGKLKVKNNTNLDYEQHQSVTLRVKVTDNGTPVLHAEADITINIIDVNEAPSWTSANTITLKHNESKILNLSATDPENSALTYSADGLPAWITFEADQHRLLISPTSIALVGEHQITVKVSDGVNETPQTITVRVIETNVAPVIADQNFSVAENSANGTLVGQVVATDANATDQLSFTILSGNDLNIFEITTDGKLKIKDNTNLDFEAHQTVTLRVQVSDDSSPVLSAEANITINITDVNEAPTISGTPATSVNQGEAYSFTPTAFDPDTTAPNNTLTFSIENKPSWANFNPATGTLTGTPANQHVGSYNNITIRVTDGNGLTATLPVFSITVNDVNDAPTISDQTFTVAENTANGTELGQVVASDPDAGQTLTYQIVSGNDLGIFEITNDGKLKVANNTNLDYEQHQSVTLRVKVTDNGTPALNAEANITINITDVNEAPNFTSGTTVTMAHNQVINHTLSATDPEGNALTYSADGLPTWINLTDNVLFFTPTLAQIGNHDIVVKVSDGTNQVTQTIHVTVREANVAPVIANQTFTVAENSINGTLVGALTATDANAGDSLSFTIVGGNDLNIFEITTDGKLKIKDNTNLDFEAHTSVTLRVRVTDNGLPAMSAEADVTVNITDVDDEAPTITVEGGTAPREIMVGEAFSAPGATCHDNQGNCTLTIANPVDPAVAGDYQLTYTAIDEASNRTVVIIPVKVKSPTPPSQPGDQGNQAGNQGNNGSQTNNGSNNSGNNQTNNTGNNQNSNHKPNNSQNTASGNSNNTGNSSDKTLTIPVDDSKPPFTINGEAEIALKQGDKYLEPGITCATGTSCSVEITGKVDTNVPGTYTITYKLTDANGKVTTVTRKVTVRGDNENHQNTGKSAESEKRFFGETIGEIFTKYLFWWWWPIPPFAVYGVYHRWKNGRQKEPSFRSNRPRF